MVPTFVCVREVAQTKACSVMPPAGHCSHSWQGQGCCGLHRPQYSHGENQVTALNVQLSDGLVALVAQGPSFHVEHI